MSDPAKLPTWAKLRAWIGGRWAKLRAWIGGRWWLWPLAVPVWFLWVLLERLNHVLPRLPLFMLLEQIAVIGAVVWWVSEAHDRAKERHYRAWELINAARGSTGEGGRIDALQDLNKDGVSLAGAPLENAYLAGINLEKGDLAGVNFNGATLTGANFKETFFGKKIITYEQEWIEICYLGICIPNTFGLKSKYQSISR